ncbi:MAG: cation diffusion facilitator family transporter [Microbacterium sp.]
MSASGGSKAIIAAFSANIGIALAKLIGWLISGSASMLAEAIHSLADSGNQLLLLLGRKKSTRRADREHPFGYGRERFVYAFVVAIILFSVGGVFSIYEGIEKVSHPHELETVWLPIIILLVAICLEGYSLRTAMKEINEVRTKGQSLFTFIRRAKAPELPVVALEDTAALLGLVLALLGLGLSAITGNPVFDAIGTICIGALLVLVAIVLGIETKSLLVGEGASDEDFTKILRAIEQGPEVEKLIHIKTLYLGPDEFLVAAKIGLPKDISVADASRDIDAVEARIREAVPAARVIYLEPDVYHAPTAEQPPTETFILRSAD